jgi:hypothetical protein
MLGKFVIIIFFIVILYNLFAGLKDLMQYGEKASDDLLKRLKWRIAVSITLFFLIIIGFLTGIIQLHTLGH